jgi:hypothetical protein
MNHILRLGLGTMIKVRVGLWFFGFWCLESDFQCFRVRFNVKFK